MYERRGKKGNSEGSWLVQLPKVVGYGLVIIEEGFGGKEINVIILSGINP